MFNTFQVKRSKELKGSLPTGVRAVGIATLKRDREKSSMLRAQCDELRTQASVLIHTLKSYRYPEFVALATRVALSGWSMNLEILPSVVYWGEEDYTVRVRVRGRGTDYGGDYVVGRHELLHNSAPQMAFHRTIEMLSAQAAKELYNPKVKF